MEKESAIKKKERKKKKTLNLRSEDPHYDIGQSKDSYRLTFLHLKMRTPVWKLTRQMFVKARGGYWRSAQEQAVVTSSGTFLSGSSLSWACAAGGGTGPSLHLCCLLIVPATSYLPSITAESCFLAMQTGPFLLEGSSSPEGPRCSAPTSTPGLCPVHPPSCPHPFF